MGVDIRFYHITVPVMLLIGLMPAQAQEFPRWEAFGGFSYANANFGPQAALFSPGNRNFYGFALAFSFNPHRNIRLLLADVAVQYGKTTATPPTGFTKVHLDTSHALFGPEFTLRRRKATAFANALVGVTNRRLSAQAATIYVDLVRETNLALGFGGGLDVNWTRRVAIRAIQAECIPTLLSGSWETTYSISTGVVFRFGFH